LPISASKTHSALLYGLEVHCKKKKKKGGLYGLEVHFKKKKKRGRAFCICMFVYFWM